MVKTRTQRNPSQYPCVTEWGFTPLTWQDFLKRFPREAKAFAETFLDGWAPEEVIAFGGYDPNCWEALYDDEVFLNPVGLPLILGNITGPGGSLWLSFIDDEFCEVVLDDDGNVIPDE